MKKEDRSWVFFLLTGQLTIAFTVLQLTNVIAWSWIWILAPLWIPVALGLVIAIIGAVVGKTR